MQHLALVERQTVETVTQMLDPQLQVTFWKLRNLHLGFQSIGLGQYEIRLKIKINNIYFCDKNIVLGRKKFLILLVLKRSCRTLLELFWVI